MRQRTTNWHRRRAALLLAAILALGLVPSAGAAGSREISNQVISNALSDTGAYLCRTVPVPQVGAVGGEWAVLGLARSGYPVPTGYFDTYSKNLEQYVTACSGQLHSKKYTEYSRVVLAVTALGKDARSVAGYDLTQPLGDYDKVVWQGLNGPIWALLALDSGNYPSPEGVRQRYVDYILARQLSSGGWSFNGTDADPDLTSMALQALAKDQDQAAVSGAVQKGLTCLSGMQNADGGFSSWGTANAESCAQGIVALTELGLSVQDSRFVKNGKTLLDALLTYYRPGQGFCHAAGEKQTDAMATEQAFYALAALQRQQAGQSSLYRMTDDADSVEALIRETVFQQARDLVQAARHLLAQQRQ